MIRSGNPKSGGKLTRSALAFAVAMGVVAGGMTVATPAFAAKKAKEAEGPKINPSPDVVKALAPIAEAINKKDFATAQAGIGAVEPMLKTNDDRYYYNSLMLNLSIGLKDGAMQYKSLRGMLDSGMVAPAQAGQFNTIAADSAVKAKDWDTAIKYARAAEATGYKPDQVYPVLAQAIWGKAGTKNLSAEPARTQVSEGLGYFRKGIAAMKAAGQTVPSQWYQVAVIKADLAGLPEITDWAQMAFDSEPNGSNLRTVLRVFQRTNPTMSNRENLDLLRLMHWSGGVALSPDYVEYAEMASKSAIYGEVKSIIEEGRQKGVLGAGDGGLFYSTATAQMAADKASLGAAERDAGKSATGKIAAATGDAFLGYGDYAKAAELYRLAVQKGSVDAAEVNTRLGIALAKSGDSAGALAVLAKVQGGVRGGLAKLWSDYITRKQSTATAAVH